MFCFCFSFFFCGVFSFSHKKPPPPPAPAAWPWPLWWGPATVRFLDRIVSHYQRTTPVSANRMSSRATDTRSARPTVGIGALEVYSRPKACGESTVNRPIRMPLPWPMTSRLASADWSCSQLACSAAAPCEPSTRRSFRIRSRMRRVREEAEHPGGAPNGVQPDSRVGVLPGETRKRRSQVGAGETPARGSAVFRFASLLGMWRAASFGDAIGDGL